MINTGTGYTSTPSVRFPQNGQGTPAVIQIAGGTTATGRAHMQLRAVSITSNANGGTGYAVGDLLTFANGTGTPATVRVSTISVATSATGLALVSLGDYTALPNGGTTASHTVSTGSGLVLNVTYAVKSIDVVTAGSGYLSTGTLVFSGGAGSGAAARFTTNTNVTNDIALTAFIVGGAARVNGDIIKQESSRRYLVKTTDGVGQCILTATNTLIPGTMTIVATDYNGNTYWVTKLTSRKALIRRKTQNGVSAWVYGVQDAQANNDYIDYARWTLGPAVGTDKTAATTKVSISSN